MTCWEKIATVKKSVFAVIAFLLPPQWKRLLKHHRKGQTFPYVASFREKIRQRKTAYHAYISDYILLKLWIEREGLHHTRSSWRVCVCYVVARTWQVGERWELLYEKRADEGNEREINERNGRACLSKFKFGRRASGRRFHHDEVGFYDKHNKGYFNLTKRRTLNWATKEIH